MKIWLGNINTTSCFKRIYVILTLEVEEYESMNVLMVDLAPQSIDSVRENGIFHLILSPHNYL
uniref:Uncharacterized protein n=1 Tax=Helianthus annuus TaxID=4232 RepID=A0A251VJ68_HELAN